MMHAMHARALLLSIVTAIFTMPVAAQSGVPTWRATEAWRVDGTENGEPFFDLREYVVSKDGTLWALDFKDQVIRRFDGSGKALSSIGRKGSGPGELRNANGMLIRRDGSIWLNDPGNGRLTVFAPDGKFLQQHLIAIRGYGYRWGAWLDHSTGELIDPFMNQSPGGAWRMDWRRWSPSAAVRDTFPMPGCGSGNIAPGMSIRAETKGKGNRYSTYPFATGGGSAADGFGGVWCADPSSTFVALVRIGRNDTLAQTRVELSRLPVGKAERAAAVAGIEKQIAAYATNDFDPAKIPSTKSAIAQLAVDDDGRLWIQHAEKYGDPSVTFDIHDKTGKHLGRLHIPHRPAMEGLPIRARGSDLWIALRDDDDVVGIARYRIAR